MRGVFDKQYDAFLMLRTYQKNLRKNSTPAEVILWSHLRDRRFHDFKFRRQQILHDFIVDFICYEKKLVIELDGGQHSEQEKYDEMRTKILEENGFRVLRFWNNDFLKDKSNILAIIYDELIKT